MLSYALLLTACTQRTAAPDAVDAPDAAPVRLRPAVVEIDYTAVQFEPQQRFGQPVPTTPGRFNVPSAIAVDSISGDFYVGDTANKRIQRFSGDGVFKNDWTTPNQGGLTVDPTDQTVLLVLAGKKQLARYAPTGEELGRIGDAEADGLVDPWDVSVHPDGRIFLLDKSAAVTVYSKAGRKLDRWKAADFDCSKAKCRTMSIAVAEDGGSVYITQSQQTQIYHYSLDGELRNTWGNDRGHEPGTLRWNRGIATDGSGRVIVADTDNERLQIFEADGSFVRWFRGPHDQESGIFHPRAVDANKKTGQIYAAAAYSHRVDRFDADGNLEQSLGGRNPEPDVLNVIRGVAIHPETGDIYATSRRDHVVKRFSADGVHERTIIPTAGDLGDIDPMWAERVTFHFWGPTAIAPDGTLWLVRQGYHYPEDPTPGEFLRQYDADGSFLRLLSSDVLEGYVEGIDIHSVSGDLFLSVSRNHEIVQLTPSGEVALRFGSDKLKSPAGLAVDEARRRVYVADTKQHKVHVFAEDGTWIESWGEKGKDEGQFRMLNTPGVSVDDCGLVYIADPRNRQVQVRAPDGNVVANLFIDTKPRDYIQDVDVYGDTVVVAGESHVQVFKRTGPRCEVVPAADQSPAVPPPTATAAPALEPAPDTPGDDRDAETTRWLETLGYIDVAEDVAAPDEKGARTLQAGSVESGGSRLYCVQTEGFAELIRADGTSLHTWRSEIDQDWLNCSLDTDGSLMVVGKEKPGHTSLKPFVARYSIDGSQQWRKHSAYHHDLLQTPDDTWLVLNARSRNVKSPDGLLKIKDNLIVELGRDGDIIGTWSIFDAIRKGPGAVEIEWPEVGEDAGRIDLLHANTLGLVGAGQGFPAGSVVVTLRHQDTVVILDPTRSEALWSWGRGTIVYPHEGFLQPNGKLLVFDNGGRDGRDRSRVLEVSVPGGEIAWKYEAPDFYSMSRGGVQRLPGGNLLITESNDGYAFEVSPAGERVWEWWNPVLDEDGHRVTLRRMKWYAEDGLPAALLR